MDRRDDVTMTTTKSALLFLTSPNTIRTVGVPGHLPLPPGKFPRSKSSDPSVRTSHHQELVAQCNLQLAECFTTSCLLHSSFPHPSFFPPPGYILTQKPSKLATYSPAPSVFRSVCANAARKTGLNEQCEDRVHDGVLRLEQPPFRARRRRRSRRRSTGWNEIRLTHRHTTHDSRGRDRDGGIPIGSQSPPVISSGLS